MGDASPGPTTKRDPETISAEAYAALSLAAADAYAAAHGMDPRRLGEEDADGIAAVRRALLAHWPTPPA